MKYCIRCKTEKSENEFSPDKRNPDGLQAKCKSCYNSHRREKYKNDLEYQTKMKERQKKYTNCSKQRAKKYVEKLSDTYVIASLKRNTSLTTFDIKKHPFLILLKRDLLIQKRKMNEEN